MLGLGHRTMVSHGVHTELNHVRSRSLSPQYSLGGSGSWPFFPSLLSWTAYFSFYISLYPSSNVHVLVQLSRADICPISPYLKWLGVIVKAEKYCSVWRRVFNCSNGSLSFVLCRHIVQGSFIYQRGCVRLFPKLFLCRSSPFF